MYTYKFVDVKHSIWTGKSKENIESIIEEYASLGWRLSQVIPVLGSAAMVSKTKIIFEKKVGDDFYSGKGRLGLIDEDSFV